MIFCAGLVLRVFVFVLMLFEELLIESRRLLSFVLSASSRKPQSANSIYCSLSTLVLNQVSKQPINCSSHVRRREDGNS